MQSDQRTAEDSSQSQANEKARSRNTWFSLYTGLYLIMVFCIFGIFFLNGKSFLWEKDGWKQTFQALQYYAKWLREIAGTLLFEHRLEIPTFSFSIGYGSDIITTLHYYVIGDPFSFLSIFVPVRYLAHFYGAMILLRLYCSGLAFSAYCFYRIDRKKQNADPCKSKDSNLRSVQDTPRPGYSPRHPVPSNAGIKLSAAVSPS